MGLENEYVKEINNLDFNLSLVSQNLEGTTRSTTIGSMAPATQNLFTFDLTGVQLKKDSKINLFFSLESDQTTAKSYTSDFSFLLTKDFNTVPELAEDPDFVFFITNYVTNIFLANNGIY